MSMFFGNVIHRNRILLAPEDDGKGGGGGGDGKPDLAKEIADLKEQNKKLNESFEALKKGKKPKDEDDGESDDDDEENDDDELDDKAKKQAAKKAKNKDGEKNLESALKFTLRSAEFLKANESLLPKDVAEIFALAEKEKFDSEVQKASAVKAGVIKSFFSLQANLDLLTPTQKIVLEDFLKLTKTGKEEKSQSVYDSIFEPALEMLKRVKKAEEVGRANSGLGTSSDVDKAHLEKMAKASKKHYLGEKTNA